MIILIGRIELEPGALPRLRPMLDRTMRLTWETSGCLSYSIAIESEDDGVMTIVERWESEAALLDYLATPIMSDFYDAMQPDIVSLDARIYDAAGERPLPPPAMRKPGLTVVGGANGISVA